MACKHLHELDELCSKHDLHLSSMDLIRIVCPQCGIEDQCPSTLQRASRAVEDDSEAGYVVVGSASPASPQ